MYIQNFSIAELSNHAFAVSLDVGVVIICHTTLIELMCVNTNTPHRRTSEVEVTAA
jgi:hypothetical protein